MKKKIPGKQISSGANRHTLKFSNAKSKSNQIKSSNHMNNINMLNNPKPRQLSVSQPVKERKNLKRKNPFDAVNDNKLVRTKITPADNTIENNPPQPKVQINLKKGIEISMPTLLIAF